MSLDSATPRQIIGTWREVLTRWNRGSIFDNESILQVQRLFYLGWLIEHMVGFKF